MKFFLKITTSVIFLIFCNIAYANEKIVFIDINKILKISKAGKNGTKQLERTHKLNNEKLKKTENELKKEEKDIISKKNILSKEEYEKKITELRKKADDYRKNRSKLMNDLTQKRALMTSSFLNQIKPIMADYSAKNSISIIIEKKNIFMGKNDLDITDEVLKIVDTKISKIQLD